MAIVRNREKLKSLVHYVVSSCDNPALLGSIKLNKVLWLSDTVAYLNTGTPITGEHYIKRQFGPVAPSMPGILSELENERKIVVIEKEAYGKPKTDYVALTPPTNISSTFSADEISLVDNVIHFVCRENTAMGISEMTHDRIWELAEIGEEIPYQAALVSSLGEVTEDDVQWAREAIEATHRA